MRNYIMHQKMEDHLIDQPDMFKSVSYFQVAPIVIRLESFAVFDSHEKMPCEFHCLPLICLDQLFSGICSDNDCYNQ